MRLFLLVAQVETIEAPLIALAHRAIPRIGEAPDDAVPSADELTSQLVFTGVLSLCPKHAGGYVMPGLIRAVARRIGPNPPEGRISPRQALGLELEESHRSLLDVGTVRPDAALALIGDLGAWSLLTEVWSERGFNVFYPEFVAAVHTILSVPASVVRGSLVLAEAQSAAREIANISNRTGSTDPREVLPLVTFDRLDVPTLEQERARLDDGDFTADEVAVMTLRTMRDRRRMAISTAQWPPPRRAWSSSSPGSPARARSRASTMPVSSWSAASISLAPGTSAEACTSSNAPSSSPNRSSPSSPSLCSRHSRWRPSATSPRVSARRASRCSPVTTSRGPASNSTPCRRTTSPTPRACTEPSTSSTSSPPPRRSRSRAPSPRPSRIRRLPLRRGPARDVLGQCGTLSQGARAGPGVPDGRS
ncbi:hypothetical protein IOD13_02800 [Brevibacterium casei]|nr:hypothetical protein [Brevibacterium casei]